jgi:hypothetical protein
MGNGSKEGPLGDVSAAAGEDTSAEGGEAGAAGRDGAAPEVTSSLEGVVETLTELVSLQTPASVWLPNKRLSLQATGKVKSRCAVLPPAHALLQINLLMPQPVLARLLLLGNGLPQASGLQGHASFALQVCMPRWLGRKSCPGMPGGREQRTWSITPVVC